jgi:hypothetical protein
MRYNALPIAVSVWSMCWHHWPYVPSSANTAICTVTGIKRVRYVTTSWEVSGTRCGEPRPKGTLPVRMEDNNVVCAGPVPAAVRGVWVGLRCGNVGRWLRSLRDQSVTGLDKGTVGGFCTCTVTFAYFDLTEEILQCGIVAYEAMCSPKVP